MSAAPILEAPTAVEAVERIAAARREVVAGMAAPAAALSDAALADAVESLARLESQVQAWQLDLAAEAERRQVGEAHADTGTAEWLARLTGNRAELLKGGLRLAEKLQSHYRTTLAALGAGRIRLEQARVIVHSLEVTEDHATAEHRETAQQILIAKATGEATRSGTPMSATQLRRAARRVYRTIDHDLHELHLSMTVKRNQHRGDTDTWLTLHDQGDGRYQGRFCISERHGQMLATILENLSAPRRYGHDTSGTPMYDDTVGGKNGGLGWADRLGIAFCEMIEHFPTDRLPRSAISMMVHVDLATLREEMADAGVATMTTGADLTPSDARRMACEAGIIPAVLGRGSVPLDLGRTARLHTDKQRQALAIRFDSCAIATCDRPFAWTEIHHPTPWADGGRTDLDNALPLCWHHHRAAHDNRYELTRHSPTEWTLQYRQRRRR